MEGEKGAEREQIVDCDARCKEESREELEEEVWIDIRS